QEVGAAFRDLGADLLVPSQRAAAELRDLEAETAGDELPGRASRAELVAGQEALVERHPVEEIHLLVVVGDQRDALRLRHGDAPECQRVVLGGGRSRITGLEAGGRL